MRNAPKERWLSLQVRDFLSRIRVVGARDGWPMQEARTVSVRRWPWLSRSMGTSCHSDSCVYDQSRKPLQRSANVVIGDLDVAGAEAVVSSIAANGGCVMFASLRGESP